MMLVTDIVLNNLPPAYTKERIKDFVEGTLDIDVQNVTIHHALPGKALVTFHSEIEFTSASENLKEFPIKEKIVGVLETQRKQFSLIVSSVEPKYLSEEFLEIYFCAEFGDGEDIVSSCQMFHNMAIVHFKTNDTTVMTHILAQRDHVPLPSKDYHILVEPFYIQFHDCLEEQLLNEKPEQDLFKAKDDMESRDIKQEKRSHNELNVGVETDSDESSDDNTHGEDSEGDHFNFDEKNQDEKLNLIKTNSFSRKERINGRKTKSSPRGVARGRILSNRGTNRCSNESEKVTDFDQSVKHKFRGSRTSVCRGRAKSINKIHHSKIEVMQTSEDEAENELFMRTSNQKNLNRHKSSFDNGHRPHYNGSTHKLTSSSESEEKSKQYMEEKNQTNFESQRLQEQTLKIFEVRESISKTKKSFLDSFLGEFGECTVKYDADQECIVFGGPEKIVRERHLMLLTELKKIKEDSIELTPSVSEILGTVWQQQCLEKLSNIIKPFGCKLLWENSSLKILAHGEDSLKSSLEVLKAEISESQLVHMEGSIADADFQSIKTFTECKFPVLVLLEKGNILIQGLKEEVIKAKRSIEDRLFNYLNVQETFDFRGPQAEYFHRVLRHKIPAILKDVKIIDEASSNTNFKVIISGTKPQVHEAIINLNKIKSTVYSQSWNLFSEFSKKEDMRLLTDSLSKSTQCIEKFEKEHDCFVIMNLPKITEIPSSHSQKYKQTRERKKTTFSKKSYGTNSLPKESEPDVVYNLSKTCQLHLKASANITREDSAVLVCVLDDKVDLRRTRVGMDFNKACTTLWKQLNDARGNSMDPSVIVTNGPFQGLPSSCQAINHVILSKWSPGSSETKLTHAVKTILTNAIRSGVTSISIPPLGCGKLLGYPSASVAQIMIHTLMSHVGLSSIKRIVLLGKDPQLMRDYKMEAQKVMPQVTAAFTSKDLAKKDQAQAAHETDINSGDSSSTDSSSDKEEEHMDTQYEGPGSVTIWTRVKEGSERVQTLNSMWTMLKKTIITHCLHVGYFNQPELKDWPKGFCRKIVCEAKKESVWIETSKNSKTNMASFIVKGEQHAVDRFIKIISVEHQHWQEKQPKRIVSSKAKRGTLEFIKHAADSTELLPSYWALSKKEEDRPGYLATKWRKLKDSVRKENSSILKDVSGETKAAIEKLVTQDLFDPSRVGHGRDAVNLNHKGIKVINVKRVENPGLFEHYNNYRKQLFQNCCTSKKMCTDIGKIPGSKGRVITTEKLPDFMKTELYWEINEHYLFHGSPITDTLVLSGPDPRVGSEGGMFGKGFYMAEMTTKADQYADKKNQRTAPGTTLKMIMFRALLGNPFLCNNNHPSVQSKDAQKLFRPPCMNCQKDVCRCSPQILYDSVMGDGTWIFREFVLYDRFKCYPEYVIYYKRV
ncbi:hypothetical protein EGW08_007026 [Elysia chlorotica]|uniref:Poly [ADP-ribose] polymerase n=1 Tax=Elysia chlorotica TaxID=188477 RepID=A0A3S0ZT20_ELYCH|nr:hypothetical protein EGW08_007026 [Elysia chlorotica]